MTTTGHRFAFSGFAALLLAPLLLAAPACGGDDGKGSDGTKNPGTIRFEKYSPQGAIASDGDDMLAFAAEDNDTKAAKICVMRNSEKKVLCLDAKTSTAKIRHIAAHAGKVAWMEYVANQETKLFLWDTKEADAEIYKVSNIAATGTYKASVALNDLGVFWSDEGRILGKSYDGLNVEINSHIPEVYRVALRGNDLYALVPYDAPNGYIWHTDVSPIAEFKTSPDDYPGERWIERGLDAPMEIAFTEDGEVCWSDHDASISGFAIWCAPAGDSSQKHRLQADAMKRSLGDPWLASLGNRLFFISERGLSRVDTSKDSDGTNDGPITTSNGGCLLTHSVATLGDEVFWACSLDLRSTSADHAVLKSPDADSGGGGDSSTKPLCKSPYNGTYAGMFHYVVRNSNTGEAVKDRVINVEVTLSCLADVNGQTTLNVTPATVDHDFFGCKNGCTPKTGSVAMLPDKLPVTAANPSKDGEGVMVLFPNGAVLGTSNQAGDLFISLNGDNLTNALDPHDKNSTWTASSTSGGDFEHDPWNERLETIQWNLIKR